LNDKRLIIRAAAFETRGWEKDLGCDLLRKFEFVSGLAKPPRDPFAGDESRQFSVERRSIWRGRVDQLARPKIEEDSLGSAYMGGVTMGERKAIKSINSAASQILPQDAVIVARGTGIEKPVTVRCPEVDSAARF
jgi:hypothetical protein